MRKILLTAILGIASILPLAAQQWGDYTLVATQNGTSTVLLDTNGNTVKTWTHTTANRTGYSCYLEPGGVVVRTVAITGNSFTGGPITGKVQKIAYDGTLLWDYTYSTTDYCLHHDICPMPNGNVLMIAYERKSAADVAAAGCTTFTGEMWPDKIIEVQPTGLNTGTVVWEWRAWDHLVQNTNPAGANYQSSIINHPELLNINYMAKKDWMHVNGVDYNPILDQITISSHALNEIYVIDHSTTTAEAASHTGGNAGKGGDFLYRFGNPAAYSATGTATIKVAHDAHWVPEGCPRAGYLGYYNNQGIANNASCGDLIQQPYAGNYQYTVVPGTTLTPTTYAFRQASGGYNSNMGSFQQLPNGNNLIAIATAGIIKEFDSTGTLLWSKTMTGAVPKAWRYAACYIDSAVPPIPTITKTGNTLTSSAATTYQWYKNGDLIPGATAQSYNATTSGKYLVRTTNSAGCVYRYATTFNFTFTPTAIGHITTQLTTTVAPNPTTGMVTIDSRSLGNRVVATVIDHLGRVVSTQTNVSALDLTTLPKGLYTLHLSNGTTTEIHKVVLQ